MPGMPVSNSQQASHLKALHIVFIHALQQSTVWPHTEARISFLPMAMVIPKVKGQKVSLCISRFRKETSVILRQWQGHWHRATQPQGHEPALPVLLSEDCSLPKVNAVEVLLWGFLSWNFYKYSAFVRVLILWPSRLKENRNERGEDVKGILA